MSLVFQTLLQSLFSILLIYLPRLVEKDVQENLRPVADNSGVTTKQEKVLFQSMRDSYEYVGYLSSSASTLITVLLTMMSVYDSGVVIPYVSELTMVIIFLALLIIGLIGQNRLRHRKKASPWFDAVLIVANIIILGYAFFITQTEKL